jgi:hypothetical protein
MSLFKFLVLPKKSNSIEEVYLTFVLKSSIVVFFMTSNFIINPALIN